MKRKGSVTKKLKKHFNLITFHIFWFIAFSLTFIVISNKISTDLISLEKYHINISNKKLFDLKLDKRGSVEQLKNNPTIISALFSNKN